MFWVDARYAKVWKIFRPKSDNAKYYDLRVSTSEKNRDDEWENSDWPARAIGKAFNQIKKGDVSESQKYAIRGKLTNVRWQDDDGEYHDNYRLLILEFGPAGKDIEPEKNESAEKKAEQAKKTKAPSAPAATDEEDPW